MVSYNVNGLRGGTAHVAEVIRACGADIACVQESPRGLRWRAKCGELARQSGLRRIAGGYPAGLLILAAERVRVIHTEARWLSFRLRYLQRGLTLTVVEVGGTRATVANMHLDLDRGGRRRHADEVLARVDATLAAYDAPAVLTGDVNETPAGPVWQALARRFQDGYALAPSGGRATFPAESPRKRIDGIFADAPFDVHACGVPDVRRVATASDHRPVRAELSLRDPSRAQGGSAQER